MIGISHIICRAVACTLLHVVHRESSLFRGTFVRHSGARLCWVDHMFRTRRLSSSSIPLCSQSSDIDGITECNEASRAAIATIKPCLMHHSLATVSIGLTMHALADPARPCAVRQYAYAYVDEEGACMGHLLRHEETYSSSPIRAHNIASLQ